MAYYQEIEASAQLKVGLSKLKGIFAGVQGASQAQFAWQVLEQLAQAGYVSGKQLERMKKQLTPSAKRAARTSMSAS